MRKRGTESSRDRERQTKRQREGQGLPFPKLLLPTSDMEGSPTLHPPWVLGTHTPIHLPRGGCVYPHCADEETEARSHQVTQPIKLDPPPQGCRRKGKAQGD